MSGWRRSTPVLLFALALTAVLGVLAAVGTLPIGVAIGIAIPVDLVIFGVVLAAHETALFMRLLGAGIGLFGLLLIGTAALVFGIGAWALIRPGDASAPAPLGVLVALPLVSVVMGGLALFYAGDLFRRARAGPDTPQPEFATTPYERLRGWLGLWVGGVLCLVAVLSVVLGVVGLVRSDAEHAAEAVGSGAFLFALFGTMVRNAWRRLFGRREV